MTAEPPQEPPQEKEEEKETHRAWARMGFGIAGALLLAYGVVKVPRMNHPAAGAGVGARPLKVLVTSFEKFGKDQDNASRVMVAALEQSLREKPLAVPVQLTHAVLPVVYGKAEAMLGDEVLKADPDVLISFGQASGENFRLEVQALNLDDSKSADNAGVIRQKQVIEKDGPQHMLSRLPVHLMAQRLKDAGFPAAVSYSAGGFLCNHVFYEQIRLLSRTPRFAARAIPAGFVHVPSLPEKGAKSYAEWGTWGGGALRIVLQTAVEAAAGHP